MYVKGFLKKNFDFSKVFCEIKKGGISPARKS